MRATPFFRPRARHGGHALAKIMADVVDFSDRTDNLPGGPGADFEKFHLRLPERHLASCAPENTQAVTGNGPALADP